MSGTERLQGPRSAHQAGQSRSRLLAGWLSGRTGNSWAEHLDRHGPVQLPSGRDQRDKLIAEVEAAGLRGRGGAGFPTAVKLRAVDSGRGRAVVLANGCEGEPASGKDAALLALEPHLVIDGAELVAAAVGANRIHLCVHRGSAAAATLRAALHDRRSAGPQIQVTEVPGRYVAGEESALVRFINTGEARPTAKPPRPFERGVEDRPTLIDNVETLAHLALIARHGAPWFRGVGTSDSPGTALVTLGGAVARPGVYEAELGTAVGDVLGLGGGSIAGMQAVLVGGYAGAWLALPDAGSVPFTHEGLRAAGGTVGVAALIALPVGGCGVAETALILRYLAGESARQCGPCMFGLPAIAADFVELARGSARGETLGRLRSRLGVIPGRGACAHPDGAARLGASALRVFAEDVHAHASGQPCTWSTQSSVVAPPPATTNPDWM
ncbi:MAG TPA: NADH-ubiquinone oxidoreductase-F iron-sulfur binding region domain-containing protein [Sporichthyaceae bacterium]|jgi:NADH:ubiquinone oxidoreductase subunit F (NADH-binding)|nr:NADH-ubiquinone oxidoreductase-F iron-sulfur binding region domain-containing protein [Sporichthyaceae bacterium]